MVLVPGTALNTQNGAHQQQITNLISGEVLPDSDLRPFVIALHAAVLQNANAQPRPAWANYEDYLFPDASLRWVRRYDAYQVFNRAQQQGVWCMGRVIVDYQADENGPQTQPVQANAANRGGAYAQVQGVQDWQRSANDAEISTLEDLSNLITGQIWQTIQQQLRVIMSGSQGPCDTCKLRIQRFISDLNQIAYVQHRQIPLIFEANYTTATNQTNQQGIPTTYGYNGPNTYTIAVAPQSQAPVRYTFWGRAFTLTLGATAQVDFRNL